MSNYSKANKSTQWFATRYPGSRLELSAATTVLVLHTTEGTSWPSYNSGATAPNYTGMPPGIKHRSGWRAHFPDEMSSRALRNLGGGVETNTLNAIQVELIGTCDPTHRKQWGKLRAGVDYVFWPDANDRQLAWLAELVADLHKRHGLALRAPLAFKPYPASYGANGVRMSGKQWRSFTGICGHQHVPENSHGDPGALPIDRVLAFAKQKGGTVSKSKSSEPTRVELARADITRGLKRLDAAVADGRTGDVRNARDAIRAGLRKLPSK